MVGLVPRRGLRKEADLEQFSIPVQNQYGLGPLAGQLVPRGTDPLGREKARHIPDVQPGVGTWTKLCGLEVEKTVRCKDCGWDAEGEVQKDCGLCLPCWQVRWAEELLQGEEEGQRIDE